MKPPARPSWEEMHYRLVSLWDIMERIPLSDLLLALRRIGSATQSIVLGHHVSWPEEDFANQRAAIATVLSIAQELGLPATEDAARGYSRALETGQRINPGIVTLSIIEAGRLKGWGSDITGRAPAEMGGRIALVVPHGKAAYYDPALPIFGKDVADKLSNGAEGLTRIGVEELTTL